MFHNDKRVPNAHFAIALLYAQKDRPAESTAEYKLLANQFPQSPLSPFALLQSSKLKITIHDYFGARQDLKQLIEQYPDAEIAGRAYLSLADVSMKAEIYDEAIRIYRKVYHIEASLESKTDAALGAAECFYEKKNYQSAAKWLIRYINLAKANPTKQLYTAYLLLGKTNLALQKPEIACNILQFALAGQLNEEKYVETIGALIKGYMQQQNPIKALNVLENVNQEKLSQKNSIEILLLKSEILRSMGLVEKAVAAIGNRAEYISEPRLKTKIRLELTKCHIAKNQLSLALENLNEIRTFVKAGPMANEIAAELADVSFKLGRDAQTISVCSQLLDANPSEKIKQKALDLLAAVYNRQKKYDRAALALSGQWNGIKTTNQKATTDRTAITRQSSEQAQ